VDASAEFFGKQLAAVALTAVYSFFISFVSDAPVSILPLPIAFSGLLYCSCLSSGFPKTAITSTAMFVPVEGLSRYAEQIGSH